ASDGTYSSSQFFLWTVNPAVAPGAPTLSNPGLQETQAGEGVARQLQATSPGGYPLTYSATGLPDGLFIDPVSGLIQGTLNEDAVSSTPSTVTVTATNNLGGSASRTFVWGTTPGPATAQALPASAFHAIHL